MHPTIVTHILAHPPHILTASDDGQLSVWQASPFTFIKSFALPLAPLALVSSPHTAQVLVLTPDTVALVSLPVYDLAPVAALPFAPLAACFVRATDNDHYVLVSRASCNRVLVLSAADLSQVDMIVTPHQYPVRHLVYSAAANCLISIDSKAVIDYWQLDMSHHSPRAVPLKNLSFRSKARTDLYYLARHSLTPTHLAVSNNGKYFVVTCTDQCVRVFDFYTGKIWRTYHVCAKDVVHTSHAIPKEELDRRLARENQVVTDPSSLGSLNAVFDPSARFVIYASVVGIHVVEMDTNQEMRVLGEREGAERFLHIALVESKGEEGALLLAGSFQSQRVYLFTSEEVAEGRDVFNERPMVKGGKDRPSASEEAKRKTALAKRAILHTSEGDVGIVLFENVAPKTVENFVTHARNGYFDRVLFHRVIKGFMIQTGDPDGDGTGGESIWGGEFDDEIDIKFSHEIGTVSMANAGPNTNGSQFFITCQPTPHLDGKHTIFGELNLFWPISPSVSLTQLLGRIATLRFAGKS